MTPHQIANRHAKQVVEDMYATRMAKNELVRSLRPGDVIGLISTDERWHGEAWIFCERLLNGAILVKAPFGEPVTLNTDRAEIRILERAS